MDRDACQTAAICLQYQLDETKPMYELDDESLAVIKTTANAKEDADGYIDLKEVAGYDESKKEQMEEIALESAKNCPFNAIIVTDDAGKVIWPEEV